MNYSIEILSEIFNQKNASLIKSKQMFDKGDISKQTHDLHRANSEPILSNLIESIIALKKHYKI